MKKLFIIFVVISSCGGSADNSVIDSSDTTTTTVADTTTTTVADTTTTTVADTTTTTVADTTISYKIISDSYYEPFTRYVDIKELRIFVTQEVSKDFIKKVADTYVIMNKINPSIDSSLRNDYYSSLKNSYVFQRVGYIGPDYYAEKTGKSFDDALSPNPINGPYDENVTDYIWEVPDASSNSQIGEVVEHLLHTITNISFARAYPDWNWYDPSSKIRQATNEAIEKNIFDASSYQTFLNRGDEEGYHKITTQEFSFWFIATSWGYADIYDLPGDEFSLSSKEQVKQQLPIAYELYEEFIEKVLNPPTKNELNNIFNR
jgi:hypothetical protein